MMSVHPIIGNQSGKMDNRKPTWAEAIEKIMKDHGFFATLKQLHAEAPLLKRHSGKTPDMTINYTVQTDKRFTKIMPGLWALTEHLKELPSHINPFILETETRRTEIGHTLMQGYLVEIGASRGWTTFSPDKNSLFLDRKLEDIISLKQCPAFTYEHVLRHIKYIDVLWFNRRLYPANVIEVEHSTNFRNSLLKFLELQDFTTQMTVVAPAERKEQFDREISRSTFNVINQRVRFVSYSEVEKIHAASATLVSSIL